MHLQNTWNICLKCDKNKKDEDTHLRNMWNKGKKKLIRQHKNIDMLLLEEMGLKC